MKNTHIVFEKLVLEGFGPHRDQTEFIFSEGVNCYIGVNETGKTSMVAGLMATIFGLSHRQKPGAFTLDRFRNWDSPLRCRGELFFSVENEGYQIQRDFDTHKVALWKTDERREQKKLLVEGEHNPEARRPLKAYEEYLDNILGISSQDVFEDSFFIGQPIPESGQISEALQSLLVGSKGTSLQDGLKRLIDKLKNLTKYTGPNDRGITGRNMSKDGELEELKDKIDLLKSELSKGKDAADHLLELQQKAFDIDKDLDEKRKQRVSKEATKKAYSDWNVLRTQYTNAAKERDALEKTLDQAKGLKSELDKLNVDLKTMYPEFENASEELEDELRELITLNQSIQESEETIEKMESEHKRLIDKKEQRESSLKEFGDMDSLGFDPIEKIKNSERASTLISKDWRMFRQDQSKLSEIQEKLSNRYAPFEEADESKLKQVKDIDYQKARLSSEINKVQKEYDAELENIKAVQEEENRHRDKFKDIMDLPKEAAEAAIQKIQLLKEKRELTFNQGSNMESKSSSIGLQILGASVFSIIAFITIGTDSLLVLAIGITVAIALGIIAGKLIGQKSRSRSENAEMTQKRLQDIDNEIAVKDNFLGVFAEADDMELIRLSERLKQYEEEKESMQKKIEKVKATDTSALKSKLEALKEEKQIFLSNAKKFTESFENVLEAFTEWQDLKREQKQLSSSIGAFAESKCGCTPDSIYDFNLYEVKDEQLKELTETLKVLGFTQIAEDSYKLGEFLDSIKDISSSWWQESREKVAKFVDKKSDFESIKIEIDSLEKRLKAEKEKFQKPLRDSEALNKKWETVLKANGNDPKNALDKYIHQKKDSSGKESKEAQIESILESQSAEEIESLEIKLSRLRDQAGGFMMKWQEHIDKYPGLPSIETSEDMELIKAKMDTLDYEIEQNRVEIESLEVQRSSLYRDLARLEGENPINIAATELDIKELENQKREMELKADAISVAYKELEASITEYQQTYKGRLEEKATSYCKDITEITSRKVYFDDQLKLGVFENGRPISIESLSKGAQDQVFLSTRFAIADFLSEDARLPMVFDDPFTSTDEQRLKRIKSTIEQQAKERQIFILSHNKDYQSWGEMIQIKS